MKLYYFFPALQVKVSYCDKWLKIKDFFFLNDLFLLPYKILLIFRKPNRIIS